MHSIEYYFGVDFFTHVNDSYHEKTENLGIILHPSVLPFMNRYRLGKVWVQDENISHYTGL